MFPRYGRKNRKYKVKVPKKKMSHTEKLKVQSAMSASVLAVGIVLSFFDFMPKNKINAYLYDTYSANEWKETFAPAGKGFDKTSAKLVSKYMAVFKEDKNGKKESIRSTPVVKAQNNETKEEAKKETPAPQEVWQMPASGEISSEFGERIHPLTGEKSVHTGIDIAANTGDAVRAVHSGTVEKVGKDDSNGNYIILSHGNGVTSVYIHLSKVLVSGGQTIGADTKIAEVGSTGASTGPHLHFEIKENGESVDPKKYIKKW